MRHPTEKTPFWEALNLPVPGAEMAHDAYLSLDETPVPMEYVHGQVVYPHWNAETHMSLTPRPIHQLIVMEVIAVLRRMVPDGRVITAPMDVQIGPHTLQPDVFWASAGGQCVIGETRFIGPPDLVVEVVSPGNATHDRITKHAIYEQQGVREYWIIDPNERYLDVFVLVEGAYRRQGAYVPADTFASVVLGQTVNVAELFAVQQS